MRSRRLTKLLPLGLGLIGLALLWFYLAPTGIGGSTSYVVTDGISMKPRFHAGDLVLVRKQSSYHVGEIVAYNSNVFHTIVLHRIIALDGDKYVFKGDNNNFVDFEHPAKSQLIGALWLHIPGAGAHLESLRSPLLLGLLVMAGTLLFAGAAFERRRRRRGKARRGAEGASLPSIGSVLRPRRKHAAPSPTAAAAAPTSPALSPQREGPPRGSGPSPRPVGSVLTAGAIVLLPFLGLAVLAFTRSTTTKVPSKTPYAQSAKFSYTAPATPGPAYPGNRALTGDPLFTRVLSTAYLRVVYNFHSPAPHAIAGTASLDALLTSTSGWRKTLVLSAPEPFRGDRAVITSSMNLPALGALLERVEKITDVNGSYSLALTPHVNVRGKVGHGNVNTTYSPQLLFTINPVELEPKDTNGSLLVDGAANESPYVQSEDGVVAGTRSEPLYLYFKLTSLSVAGARAISVVGILLTIAAMLAAIAWLRPRRREESAEIQARYRRMIVPVERVRPMPGVSVIEVSDIDALARIAEHYDRSILHELTDDGDAFWVTDESGQFRYTVGSSPAPAQGSQLAEHPLDLLVSEQYVAEPVGAGAAAGLEYARTAEHAAVDCAEPGESATDDARAPTQPVRERAYPADTGAADAGGTATDAGEYDAQGDEQRTPEGLDAGEQAPEIAAVDEQATPEYAHAMTPAESPEDVAAREAAEREAADAAMRETNAWNAAWEAGAGDRRGGSAFLPRAGF